MFADPAHPASRPPPERGFKREFTLPAWILTALLVLAILAPVVGLGDDKRQAVQRQSFTDAWEAARQGNHEAFRQAMPGLRDYLLYPYLQYEDYRQRRARVPAEEMAGFLDEHRDWAFTGALERAWLLTLGARGQWGAVLEYGEASKDVTVRCHVARARIKAGDIEGLLPEARQLWAAGRSQPDACDPVFAWLRRALPR